MEVSEAPHTSERLSLTGPSARPEKKKKKQQGVVKKRKWERCDMAAHWKVKGGDRGVEAGTAFDVYSSETVMPGSLFGSNISQAHTDL